MGIGGKRDPPPNTRYHVVDALPDCVRLKQQQVNSGRRQEHDAYEPIRLPEGVRGMELLKLG